MLNERAGSTTRNSSCLRPLGQALPPEGERMSAVQSHLSHPLGTGEGDLHRKPASFRLALDYRVPFETANKGSQKRRELQGQERRRLACAKDPRPPLALPEARVLKSPKSISEAETSGQANEIRECT